MTIAAEVFNTKGCGRPNLAPSISELLNNLKRLMEVCGGLCFGFNCIKASVRPQLQSDIYERGRARLSPDLAPYEENKIRERAKLGKKQKGSEHQVTDAWDDDSVSLEELVKRRDR
ncbi:MAG: hypothetical protein NZT61_07915 [Deltaproteobacteria bacterium]|nr:hypothetical protein [Deltaproteobacteria bacterium]MCX7952782.1 hypothetical protein [Deltaproteobacteria bacterium]